MNNNEAGRTGEEGRKRKVGVAAKTKQRKAKTHGATENEGRASHSWGVRDFVFYRDGGDIHNDSLGTKASPRKKRTFFFIYLLKEFMTVGHGKALAKGVRWNMLALSQ